MRAAHDREHLNPKRPPEQVARWFRRVREFVGKRFPWLATVNCEFWCPQIKAARQRDGRRLAGRRYFAHVGHVPHAVCLWSPAALRLAPSHLVGLFLHEFGHLKTGGDDVVADSWVFANFGLVIEYKSSLCLEWVSPQTIRAAGI